MAPSSQNSPAASAGPGSCRLILEQPILEQPIQEWIGSEELLDCVILGAGPAGLTALEYLARFRRRVVALGGAGPRPRLLLIDRTYNLPGYPEGIPGSSILRRLREQAEKMGGHVLDATAERVDGSNGSFTIHLESGPPLRARKIILAMGVRDIDPDVPGIEAHAGKFVRYCPICDGFEHQDKRLGIVGSGPGVARHALFLRTFSDQISIFLHGEHPEGLGRYRESLDRCGISVHVPRVVRILEDGNSGSEYEGKGVLLEDGSRHPLAVLYSSMGCHLNLDPVRHLNLKLDNEEFVITNSSQQTSIPGIFAAGDLVSQISQISVAFGQAAIAAVRIHSELDDDDNPETTRKE